MFSSVFYLLVLAVTRSSIVEATGYIGCLFSEDLCNEATQWCFDDGAFGKCINRLDTADPESLYRHELDKEDLDTLEYELEKLLQTGYKWSHMHTQCVLHALLYSFRTGNDFERAICDRLKEKDLEDAQDTKDSEKSPSPVNVAFIKYTPSEENPRSDFADEVYFPPKQQPTSFDELGKNEEEEPLAGVVRRSLPPEQKWNHFSTLYNTPAHFRSGFELKDLPDDSDPIEGGFFQEIVPDIDKEEDLGFIRAQDYYQNEKNPSTVYTEGGVLYMPETSRNNYMTKEDLLESLGFKRRERLDVKKPGPPYGPTFQQTTVNPEKKSSNEVGQKEVVANELPVRPIKSLPWSKAKKLAEQTDPDLYDVVDTTYAYIQFQNSIREWKEGSRIVKAVAKLLKVTPNIFSHERVDRNEVTFRVNEPNKFGLNASEVARRIDGIKDELRRETGVIVTSTGIGDKVKLPSVVHLDGRPDHQVYIVTVIVCGVLAALALSGGVLYLTRKHGHKLKSMTSDTEPSKHYQDLCRARMSTKTTQQAQDSPAPAQRITSLSKESDKDSPSSRSSTSSWSDEPALTNMDVSTGQQVLTYLEEHLKNKERLDSEWTALCAYEADPCATTIAQRPENLQKNRYPHALPYDHARVVLNELSNITESDYINASAIADHDPRNAAYIVAQGPLPHTVPDLWQMVWEQGCVVLVMLTRLEVNETQLCHRYWPEDGSEIYHIYEVHLVGEYMWCDDYVVRSFYLKNLKTGETRTVTQFHFLSWPEGGVPTGTKSLLEFRRKVNKSFRGRSCPIVVHCSDGIGRSGAYCLLDMVLNRIAKGAKEIDIAATLEHIRDQRAGTVSTKEQFQFVLTAVADEVQAILKVLQQQ
ncbi:receptor-type tyrosine-protein phosphatase N2 [Cimex lectularius]|uniref:Receptor-type tyrosine-protein phosphatase N2 n=1 Tax=Cimex lectularius TaxID=79782 RepID=A0A8I6SFB1_CIMLE|nr:receptor-type tyrosine-protein phosphatase N2 [Cimex lectularius]